MEQHRSVCPLEPVACEMKEFGCSVVVPRKELATHMRESELQHLTAMIALNLRLTGQLQLDSAERDRKIEQLQQEVLELKNEQKKELAEVKGQIQRVHCISEHIEHHAAVCTGCKILTFRNYNEAKIKAQEKGPYQSHGGIFYSRFSGYAFELVIRYYPKINNDIGTFLYLMKGETDNQLQWPVEVRVQLQLLNQAGDHRHVARMKILEWKKCERGNCRIIDNHLMKYTDLERRGNDVQYMIDDCLKFRIHISIM